MTASRTTLKDVTAALAEMDQSAPLIFETSAGPIGAGYHVTEFKLAEITSIDCGAQVNHWRETVLQLLDGARGKHMSVGKFAAIARQSTKSLPGLQDLPFSIEFAPGNAGLRRYELGALGQQNGQVTVRLLDGRAQCKPAMRITTAPPTTNGSVAKARTGCCGSDPDVPRDKAACCY